MCLHIPFLYIPFFFVHCFVLHSSHHTYLSGLYSAAGLAGPSGDVAAWVASMRAEKQKNQAEIQKLAEQLMNLTTKIEQAKADKVSLEAKQASESTNTIQHNSTSGRHIAGREVLVVT